MSTTPTEPTTAAPAADPKPVEAPKPAPPAETRTFTQAELDQIIQKRLEKYRDYDDVKAKASKFDEAEEAAKSEAQKLADRLAAAEKKADEAEIKALRADVAAAKGVPVSLLSGSTQEELEASADALLAFRGEAPKLPAAPSASGQGRVGDPIGGAQQLSRDALKGMSPEDIVAAKAAGRLNDLLGIKN